MSTPNQLFQSMLSSEIKGDLLVLFHKNPGLIDSLDGVARRIGRVGTAIQADVQDMGNVRILGTRQIGGRETIFLDRSGDKAAQETIIQYLKNLRGKTEQIRMTRQKTGIVELDAMLRGGFLERDAVMVAGSAGTGKTTLSLQHLVNGITKFGEPGIYLTFEQLPDQIYRDAENFGWDLKKLEEQGKL